MSLLADLRTARERKTVCKFCDWIASRPDDERSEWAEAVTDRSFPVSALHAQATKRGYDGATHRIQEHRAGKHKP